MFNPSLVDVDIVYFYLTKAWSIQLLCRQYVCITLKYNILSIVLFQIKFRIELLM